MTKNASRTPIKPFLIHKDDGGVVRLTVRSTHFNSWNYPIVTSSVLDEAFATASAARAHAKEHFGAQAGDIVST